MFVSFEVPAESQGVAEKILGQHQGFSAVLPV
jgi:hypothetical protein